ncbi:MAG TPA: ATP-binding protein [Gemmataceae bacterium]|nr:ATP-binding protein [Gemmataceae bacterium]
MTRYTPRMRRFPLSWRLFFALGTLLVVTLGGLGLVGAARLEQMELDAVQDRLSTKAAVLDDLARTEGLPELQSQLGSLHDQFHSRITLIAIDGTVIADSDRDEPSKLDNHGERPEIVDARTHPFGTATRYSATLHQPMMYVARRVGDGKSSVAFVRVAMPVERIESDIRNLRFLICIIVGMTAALALILAWTFVRRLTEPLDELERGATAVAEGHYGQRVYVEGDDGIGRVASAFNAMSARLAEQVAQLEHDRQQLRAVLGSMVEGVIAIDGEFNVTFANDHAAVLFAFVGPQATGRKLWEIVRHRQVLDLANRMLASQGEPESLMSIAHGDRSITARAAPLPSSPASGAVFVFHDMTDLARLERVRQEFVANVSHELKTPLAVIMGCVETLQSGAIDDHENRDRFLDSIASQSSRLSALVNDLLTLARIETDAEYRPLQDVVLQEIVDKCIRRQQVKASVRQLQLNARPDAPAGVVVSAIDTALGQVLDHLVSNALEYTPAGGAIEIHWHVEGSRCFIEVRDTGIGIPAGDLERIFERFYRVDKARSRDSGGAGLGLSMVKHLVHKMGGSVHATSEPGKGSTFVVGLNLATPPAITQ